VAATVDRVLGDALRAASTTLRGRCL
jgi:hypothetical protein